jgi:hypothetical protein
MGENDKLDRRKTSELRRAEESARFWARKEKWTYYLVSLPFAIGGAAIASYRPSAGMFWLALLEVLAWMTLLLSGIAGVVAKWGEMEQARISSLMAASDSASSDPNLRSASFDDSVAKMKDLWKAERVEQRCTSWHWRLLLVGIVIWFLSRSLLALGA